MEVAICCFTYNQSAYITDALKGFVMQQTNFPFVAVVVDDASTDGEQEVIKAYVEECFDHSEESGYKQWETEDAFWTFARHKENENCHVVAVLLKKNLWREPDKKDNVVKDWMDAKYIAICEGDDYWTNPLKLQKQVGFLEKHEEYCMTASASCWIRDGRIVKNDRISDEPRELSTEEVIKGGGDYLATCSFVFDNKKLNGVIPEWRRMANVGDYPLQIQGTIAGQLWYFPDCMSVYRTDCNGGWVSTVYGNVESRLKHWQAEIGWMKELDLETNRKYQRAIYEHLLPYYHVLYKLGMVSNKEYFHHVFVVGRWRYYYRMMKDFVKRLIHPCVGINE